MLCCVQWEKTNDFKISCVCTGHAQRCGDLRKSVDEVFSEIDADHDKVFTWSHWERESKDDGTGKRILKVKEGSAADFLKEFKDDVASPTQGVTFVKHLFTARWQQRQF